MAYTQLIPRHTKDARVEEISSEASHYLLSIPAGKADKYRLAQLDDYTKLTRRRFPFQPPVRLQLAARTSSRSIPGTWGFGLWNDPFGLSLGFGGNPLRFPALPNAVWFFGASPENHLSFQPAGMAANGFLAQTFRSPGFDLRLIPAGLAIPFSRKTTRRWLGKIIQEDSAQLAIAASLPGIQEHATGFQGVDPTQWHEYRLDWRERRVSFAVDDALLFESPVSPQALLGVVIWIDNQFASFTPEGKIGFGVLANPEPAWLEIKDVNIK